MDIREEKLQYQKLSKASGSTKEEAENCLMRQPLYQIYLPPPKYIPRPNASMSSQAKPNGIHQADILYPGEGGIPVFKGGVVPQPIFSSPNQRIFH